MASIPQDLVGREVYARDGGKVGEIKELVYEGEYCVVRRSWLCKLVVPVRAIDSSGDRLLSYHSPRRIWTTHPRSTPSTRCRPRTRGGSTGSTCSGRHRPQMLRRRAAFAARRLFFEERGWLLGAPAEGGQPAGPVAASVGPHALHGGGAGDRRAPHRLLGAAALAGLSGAASGARPSMLTLGSHSSQRGRYQFQSPSSSMAAGTRIVRTIVASMKIGDGQAEAHLLEHDQLAGGDAARRRPP